MRLIKIGLLLFFIGMLPYLLGALPLSLHQEEKENSICHDRNKPGITIIAGWFLMFALFQMVAVPVIILQLPFTHLVILYDIVLCIALAMSFYRGKEVFIRHRDALRDWWITIKKKRWSVEKIGYLTGCILALALLLLQLVTTFRMEHYDGDDAYYVAASVATDLYDTMYVRDNYTGYQFTLESRHALSPAPIFIAWLTRMTGIHSTILAHSVLGPAWIALMYLIYWQIALRVCRHKRQYSSWFMVFLMLWFLFGNVSIYTTETFALTRIWQGKGLFTAIVIPTMFLCLFDMYQRYEENKNIRKEWFLLLCCVFASVLATSTSVFLVPVFLGLAGVLYAVRFRRAGVLLHFGTAILPALFYGILYILLK